MINFSQYKASSDLIYITLDILPLQKLATHRIALMMYKYSHGMLPQMIQDIYLCILIMQCIIMQLSKVIYCISCQVFTQKMFAIKVYVSHN